jgi:hypothetical protein
MRWRPGIRIRSVRQRTIPNRPRVRGSHTTGVNLQAAAFFALIAMLLLTFLDAASFLNDLIAFSRDAIAAMTLLSAALIFWPASQ